MRRILKALILVLTLSVVLAAFTACDITEKKNNVGNADDCFTSIYRK